MDRSGPAQYLGDRKLSYRFFGSGKLRYCYGLNITFFPCLFGSTRLIRKKSKVDMNEKSICAIPVWFKGYELTERLK